MSEVSFTFDWYAELLDRLTTENLTPGRYDKPITDSTVLLRHDIDWSPRKARQFAKIESEHGVSSTFFFLLSSPFYNPLNKETREVMTDVAALGHTIGLHFSTHQYWSKEPTDDELLRRVEDELAVLEKIIGTSVEIVSFHNPPEWILEKQFDQFISTYEPRFFNDIAYRADSNQRWRDDPPFETEIPQPIQILTHPVLWGEQDGYATDRLREERDYLEKRVANHLEVTDRTWEGPFGL